MSNIIEFKKPEKFGVIKYGTVTVDPDGTVIARGFRFNGVDPFTGVELIKSWVIDSMNKNQDD